MMKVVFLNILMVCMAVMSYAQSSVVNVVRERYPYLYNLEVDSQAISEMLSQGKYVMHHSRRFNAAYHPHYRIIRHDIFVRDILPHLPK